MANRIHEFTFIGQNAWHETYMFTILEENINGELSILVRYGKENHRVDLLDQDFFIEKVEQTGIGMIDNNAYDYCTEDAGYWSVCIRYDDKEIFTRGTMYMPDEVCKLHALLGMECRYQTHKWGKHYHKMNDLERIEKIRAAQEMERFVRQISRE